METLLLSYQECAVRYGLNRPTLLAFVELGVLAPAAAPDTIAVEEPDELLPRLVRLHHGLDLAPEAVELVLELRQRLLGLQAALARETARARQLEAFLQGGGPLLGE